MEEYADRIKYNFGYMDVCSKKICWDVGNNINGFIMIQWLKVES